MSFLFFFHSIENGFNTPYLSLYSSPFKCWTFWWTSPVVLSSTTRSRFKYGTQAWTQHSKWALTKALYEGERIFRSQDWTPSLTGTDLHLPPSRKQASHLGCVICYPGETSGQLDWFAMATHGQIIPRSVGSNFDILEVYWGSMGRKNKLAMSNCSKVEGTDK